MGFKPGQSGNPSGRPRGGINLTRLRKQINTPEILKVVEQAAMSGDMTAARLLLERSLSALRPVDVPVVLPLADNLADAGRSVLHAVSSGKLTPVGGSTLMSGLSQLGRVIEVDELAKRVEALENVK